MAEYKHKKQLKRAIKEEFRDAYVDSIDPDDDGTNPDHIKAFILQFIEENENTTHYSSILLKHYREDFDG
jgi:hypothetical protein